MIITLIGADFSNSNIGTLSTWTISRVLGSGTTYNGVNYVDKNAAFEATITIDEGYEISPAGVTVTMGGTAISAATVSDDGLTVTISIASVTGKVVIKVPTVATSTGEETPEEVIEVKTFPLTWESGGIDVSKGTNNTMSNRRRTVDFIPIEYAFGMVNTTKSIHVLFFDENYGFLVHTASSTAETISLTAETPTNLLRYMPSGAAYIKLVARTGEATQDEHWYPLYNTMEHLFDPAIVAWEAGGINVNSGSIDSDTASSVTTRRRTSNFIPISYKNAITSGDVDVHVIYYDANCQYVGTTMSGESATFVSMTAGVTQNLCKQAPDNAAYYKLVARTSDATQDNYWTFSK